MRSLSLGILLSFALATAAKADVLAGGPIFGTVSQTRADCLLFNAGSSSVSITSVTLYDDGGSAVSPNVNTCSSHPLGPNRTCYVFATINLHWYSCKAVVASKTNIRGTLEIRDAQAAVLDNVELR
jgi:hypothetical protein